MGKRGGWFSAVKRALYSNSSEKEDQKRDRSKKKWLGKSARAPSDTVLTPGDVEALPVTAPPPPLENLNLAQVEDEQSKHAYSVALATAVAAEAAVAAAQAAAEVVRLTSVARYSDKSKEEIASIKIQTVSAQAAAEVVRLTSVARYSDKSKEEIASIKIQTVFRGYMARRALRALRGLVRLKTMIEGQSMKIQAATTLRYMQMLSRLQSQVRARRIMMSEENQALQRQLRHKQEKEIEKLRLAGSWNDSMHSKEQMEANLLHKQEAAIRREKALAYLFSNRKTWRNSKSANQMFMDPGWSWLERWMELRPWDARTTPGKANNRASLKSEEVTSAISGGGLNRSNSSRHDYSKPSSTTPNTTRARSQHYSPLTPTSNDSRSMFSVQSEMVRRHSIVGSSSVRDDESITSTPTVPNYMAPTMSTKAKSRVPSPLRVNENGTITMSGKASVGSARKRLSFPSSPRGSVGVRRHSGPPKVDISSIKGLGM